MTLMRRSFALAACAAAATGLAACGSSSDSDSTTSSSSGSATAAAAAPSKSFTFGYSEATGQNPWMTAIGTAAQKVTAPAGGKADVADAQLDPAKAVQQVTRFMTDGVNSIAVAPAQVPAAVTGVLTKAHNQGIHIFGLEWSYAADETAAPAAPVDGQVLVDRGQLGKDVAAAINEAQPNGAKVLYIGLPFPVVGVDFFEKNFKASLGKSKLLANLDNPKDNAQGALGPLNGALSAHPETTAIVTYNGPSALAAIQAIKTAGLTDKVKIYNIQLDTATAAALKAGKIAAAWDLNPPELGTALGQMITAAGQDKPKSEWAKSVVIKAPKYTTDNIASWTDWANG
jgi:ABC-type sugar transport system substrate-binding protein